MQLNHFISIIEKGETKEYLFPTLRICLVESGIFDWQFGAKTYSFCAGDIVLLNNLMPRRIKNNKTTLRMQIFEFLPIEIKNRPHLLHAFYSAEPTILSTDNARPLAALLNLLAQTYNTVKSQSFFTHGIQALFDLIEESAPSTSEILKHTEEAFRASEFVWKHFRESFTVPVLAAHLHISKSHLEKCFKQTHGISIGAYIRAVRIYHVLSALENTPTRSVLDIAFECGFNSSSGFYKAYKTITGKCPKRNERSHHTSNL